MAFSLNGGASGGRRRFHGSPALAEINVTPFVVVVLVLLVIFMLTAHVMEFGIEVEVPKVKQVKDTAKELAVVSITRAGNLYLNEKGVNINELRDLVQTNYRGQSVYLKADRGTPWDTVAQVMSMLNLAKIGINVVTQPDEETDKRTR
jgi:biopolymer transport protein ExbD